MKIINAIIKQKTSILLSTLTDEILLNINKPNHELNGPGKTGIILPIIPTITTKKDNINKNISILDLRMFLNKFN